MFKLLAFFAILAVAFAAPKPDPLNYYAAGYPLAYSSLGSPLAYSNLGYNYIPYASNYYNYYQSPLAYRYY